MPKRKCESCGIMEGGGLCNEVLTKYRGHNICSSCRVAWKRAEKILNKEIELDDFATGKSVNKYIRELK